MEKLITDIAAVLTSDQAMEKLITDIAAVLASDQQVLYKQLQEEAAAERKNIRAKTE